MQLEITERKYYTSFRNGKNFDENLNDFVTNLVGIVGDEVKAVLTIEISWKSVSSFTNPWQVTTRTGLNKYKVEQLGSGNFIDDGWAVGNTFDYFSNVDTPSPILEGTGVIDFISDDGQYVFVTCAELTANRFDDISFRALASSVPNQLHTLIYTPVLLENSSTFSPLSLLNNTESGYYTTEARNGNVLMKPLGLNKSNITGEARINHISDVFYVQTYQIEEIFIINPFYQIGDDFITTPTFLTGTNSLKHTFKVDFRDSMSQPNSNKTAIFDNNKGAVGYYNETLFKGIPSYELINTSGEITAQGTNNLQFTINGNFDANTKYKILVAKLDDYNNNNLFKDNFYYHYETALLNQNLTFPSPLTPIKSLSSQIINTNLVIDANIDVNLEAGVNVIIIVQVGDVSIDNGNSDRISFIAYNDEVQNVIGNNDLVIFGNINFTDYSLTDEVIPSYHNEDGFTVNFNFQLDRNKQTILNTLTCDLVATNGINEFSLSEYIIPINTLISNNIQQINTNTNRGYFMNFNSQFNEVNINIDEEVNGLVNYIANVGFKINWLEWLKNINVDPIFYDINQPNQNQNFKTSNYSNLNDYEIKMSFKFDATGEDINGGISQQRYEFYSQKINVYDYLTDGTDTPEITPIIETRSLDGIANYNGNIRGDEDTLFRVRWLFNNNVVGTIGSNVIHRIEQTGQLGSNIHELTNNLTEINTLNNILKPKNGFNGVDLYLLNNNEIISECVIDYTKLNKDTNYNLSAKINKL